MQARLGFTFIELLIVIVVMAILLTIAVPSYQYFIIQNNISAAAQTLLKNAQYLHKWLDMCGNYVFDTSNPQTPQCFNASSNPSALEWPILPYQTYPEQGEALYKITFSSIKPTGSDFNNFRLRATPLCGKIQAQSGCICLDQDSNIVDHANVSCIPSNTLCECINS